MPVLLRYAAFAEVPSGGNPAGVVLDAGALGASRMQSIATAVGYSETAFLTPLGAGRHRVRYFSPEAEVPFCGHATVASAVALFREKQLRSLVFETGVGDVPVSVSDDGGVPVATLTSVTPRIETASPELLAEALAALGWREDALDPALPVRVAFAGARHLILAAATRDRLRALEYDFERLRTAMLAHDLTTVDLVWRETQTVFHARNPFPVGGVIEDPATGAAAAAFGAYLRALELVPTPADVVVLQGEDMGRPGRLAIGIDADPASGIRVGGTAVPMAPAEPVSRFEADVAGNRAANVAAETSTCAP
ncbi:MAG: PhzF family phenazine biosynthesis protein [Pseudomonadota bacterium]